MTAQSQWFQASSLDDWGVIEGTRVKDPVSGMTSKRRNRNGIALISPSCLGRCRRLEVQFVVCIALRFFLSWLKLFCPWVSTLLWLRAKSFPIDLLQRLFFFRRLLKWQRPLIFPCPLKEGFNSNVFSVFVIKYWKNEKTVSLSLRNPIHL